MNDSFNAVILVWPLLVGLVGVIVWSIRQEGRISLTQSHIKNVQNWFTSDLNAVKEDAKQTRQDLLSAIKELKEDMDRTLVDHGEMSRDLKDKLHHIEITLARVEGRLSRAPNPNERAEK
jgi:esterase/lipase